MAERRMFAKSVIGAARFLRMPPTSRLLYYDLGMAADDDGVVEAFSVMRTTGATEDDLRVLDSKGFVRVLNEDLVTYISDWNRNNYIQKDRYHPSIYTELLVQLDAGNSADTPCIHDVSKMDTQVRLGKDRLGKDRGSEGEMPPGQRPHSLAEVEDYCASQGFTMRPDKFFDYYEARGWMMGRSPIRDWKAAARSWESREKKADSAPMAGTSGFHDA